MSRPHSLRSLCSWLCVSLLWLVFALGQPAPVGAFTRLPTQINTQAPDAAGYRPPLVPGDQQPAAVGPLDGTMAASPLQVVLDQSVRQSVLASGWSMLALTSTLSLADPTGTAVRQSGSGHWHVDALEAGSHDKPPAPFALDGTLAFELRVQPQGNTPSAASLTLKGSLNTDKTELAIDLAGNATSDGDAQTQSVSGTLRATRNDQAHTVTLRTTVESNLAAYGLLRITMHSVLNRDGSPSLSDQILTVREYGKGEREIWLHAAEAPANAAARLLDNHSFQRAAGGTVSEYLDQIDVQAADAHYALQQPALLTTGATGNAAYDLTLVDQQGQRIQLSSALQPVEPAAQPTATSFYRINGLLSPLLMPPLLPARDSASSPSSPCRPYWSFAVVGGSQPFALAVLSRYQWQQAWQLGIHLASSTQSVADSAVVMGSASIASLLATLTTADPSTLCSADGNFVAADNRALDVMGMGPLQITRVTGGVLPANALPADPPAVTLSTAASPPFTYQERADAFAASAPPRGSTVIGAWTVDSTRAFRGEPSHTQPPAGGLQQHYFIHASTPLSVTTGDEIVQYVYLDALNPPAEIFLQFYTGDGNGEHRVFWGDDRVQTGGSAGTPSLFPLGPLPEKGVWVRLRVPAAVLNLRGESITGILYGAYNGQTYWGPTTSAARDTDSAPEQLMLAEPAIPAGIAPGAQVALGLSQPMTLTAEIVDAQGATVRTLFKEQARPAGYQVVLWNGNDSAGAAVSDKPYRVRFSSGGAILAEAMVSISPLIARIASPGAYGVVRGLAVPLFGEAYGEQFSRYILEYGEGLNPSHWVTILESNRVATLPSPSVLAHDVAGNLANWNTGRDDASSSQSAGLSGLYTLRLRVIGNDGREAMDTLPLLVGRVASATQGGTLISADGKARLTLPPFAARDPFALLGLAQTESNGDWHASLPVDKKLASDVYEIYPASEAFRHTVTLELTYTPINSADKLGIMLNDGTPAGWRYLGGRADPQQPIMRVTLSEFAGRRALVAVFAADQFGPAQTPQAASAPLSIEARGAAPYVISGTLPFAFYNDFESSGPAGSPTAVEWEALDARGTQLLRVRGPAAFFASDGNALRITRLAGGVRLVRARTSPFDAAQFPILTFDYRVPAESAPNLLVLSNGTWWQLRMGTGGGQSILQAINLPTTVSSLVVPALIRDNNWHRYQIDLLAALRAAQPSASKFQVDSIGFGQLDSVGFGQVQPGDDGPVGSAYSLDNFAALAPVNSTVFTLWLGAPGTAFNGYSYRIDQNNDTVTQAVVQAATGRISVTLPTNAADGIWYVHTRGRDTTGLWSVPGHFPLLVDREPPQVGRSLPAANGAGSLDTIIVPLVERSALDFSSLQLQLNGKNYGAGAGISFDPIGQNLWIRPALLQPPATFANGRSVDVAINALTDTAGNGLPAPVHWRLTPDRPDVSGDNFQQLTLDGGESPALSPDGSQLAFVSRRSGVQKIWLIRSVDGTEESQSARPLTIGAARESDPAWSPDGRFLAYVSDAGGRPQLWIAGILRQAQAAPGDAHLDSGARALATGAGIVASPAWSPDGNTLLFIRDGNLGQINADGNAMQMLTAYPEQPLRAVRWEAAGRRVLLDFDLHGKGVALYDLAEGELRLLAAGGAHDAEWLNARTVLYTAPDSEGLDAIWQATLDGAPPSLLDGSGLPDIADAQPAASRNGMKLAMSSLRDGLWNVWLRTNAQFTGFEVTPVLSAPPVAPTPVITQVAATQPGSMLPAIVMPIQIAYALPSDAEVTLQILTGDATVNVLNHTKQLQGIQRIHWNGAGADGKPLAPGDYTVRLLVQADVGLFERYGTARIVDAASLGNLQVQVDQWAGVRLADPRTLEVQLFPHGLRAQPVAQSAGDASPQFTLPAGQYDVLVTANGVHRTVSDVPVEAGKSSTQAVDLQLGSLQIALLNAPDQPIAGTASVQLVSSDDPQQTPIVTQKSAPAAFALPAGRYDIYATYQDMTQVLWDVEVKAGLNTQQPINFGSGLLALTVRSFAGQPAETNGRLVVEAFRPANHDEPIASDTNNPTQLRVPGGVFDIRIRYGADGLHPIAGGTVEQWLNGVTVQPEQTLSQDVDLRLGQVKLDVQEAEGKPAEAARLTFHLYHIADPDHSAASALFANTAVFQLSAGEYVMLVDYGDTELRHEGRVTVVTVVPGQSHAQTINLKLGRIRLLVADGNGEPVDESQLRADAYPAGSRAASFAAVFGANPLVLAVRAGTPYDLVLGLGVRQLVVPAQSVKEGDELEIKLSDRDFK